MERYKPFEKMNETVYFVITLCDNWDLITPPCCSDHLKTRSCGLCHCVKATTVFIESNSLFLHCCTEAKTCWFALLYKSNSFLFTLLHESDDMLLTLLHACMKAMVCCLHFYRKVT